ncbi:50S ribosomal protein L18 [Vallitaleaceae bacterium 9-2]
MIKKVSRTSVRVKKHKKLRNKFSGTAERPRLSVYRSNNHIYAQIIDDTKGHTLVSASSKNLGLEKTNDVAAAVSVGEAIAKKALEANIEAVVFDRGGYIYHGKIKSLADAAREAGLKF